MILAITCRPSTMSWCVPIPNAATNWVMQIAYQIAMRGRGEFAHIHDVVPWPDFARQDLVVPLSDDTARKAAPTGLRVIKTHLAWDRIPYNRTGALHLRDPRSQRHLCLLLSLCPRGDVRAH